MTRQLSLPGPFDLAFTLTMGQAFRWRPLGDGWFSGVIGENLIHIGQPDGLDGPVTYRIGGPEGERPATDKDDAMLLRYFREDDDVAAIYADIRRDPVVDDLVKKHPGMRVLRQERWECLVSYICAATASIDGIKRNVEKIAAQSRCAVCLDDDVRYIFPTAEQIIRVGLPALRDLRLGLERADSLFTAAQQVCNGALNLDGLSSKGTSSIDAARRLDACPGIGPKIANCIALMSLDKLDAFAVDLWVLRALEHWYYQQKDCPTVKKDSKGKYQLYDSIHWRLINWAQGYFGKYTGYAGQYLFHGIEPHKEYVRRDGSCPCCEAEALAAGLRYQGPVWK